MKVLRMINGIEIEVEISESNAIYFDEKDAKEIGNSGYELDAIFNYLYNINEQYRPLVMTLELTKTCNYRCPFCFINTDEARKRQSSQIKYDAIKEDLEWLCQNGLLYCIITGGEPLLHPDFIKIYSFLKQHGVIVTVFTNISLLNNDIIALFEKYPPFKLETTMYGFSDKKYTDITGQIYFKASDFKNKVLLLKERGINIICKTPINNLTLPEFEIMRKWCMDNNIPYYFSEKVFETYEGISMQQYDITLKEKQYILHERMLSEKSESLILFGKKKSFTCGAGKYGFFISHDYKLRPCMSFFDIPEACIHITYGNISKSFEMLYKFISQYKGYTLSECNGCNAFSICKICVIDEIKKKKGETSGYKQKCANNMEICKYLVECTKE
ncbi:MAG: radical SAM protein [Blautia sp.]|nr:radical SAM protein [Lachnoclostridium sp.]MCM1211645.1 radical SAM protein [Blautia sp.]